MFQNPLLVVGLIVIGGVVGYVFRRFSAASKASSLEGKLKLQLEKAETDAKAILVEAKDKAAAFLDEAKKEERERKIQLDKTEERILKKDEQIERQSRELQNRETQFREEATRLQGVKNEAFELERKARVELERVAGISIESAKSELMAKVESEHRQDLFQALNKLEKEREEALEKKSLEIITASLHRYARTHVADLTTAIFTIPNEELKGKIIGREGRNIRAFERATGVEVLMDESPDTIVFSSFDPLRREIAKIAMEKLIKDGRIQPAKIDEKVEETKNELTKRMIQLGEQAAQDVGIYDLPKEILQLVGRLHFRTSYGQNVLVHSVEMAHVSGMLAAELGANVDVAKRGALLHDIGKAISHEVEGTHVDLGRKLLKKYGIAEPVIRAMESHHEEYPFSTPESFIVTAADVLSAARPGARRDTVENYLKRLEELEKIVNGFQGVKNSYALSAGREIRVFVVPEKVDDFAALQMAKDIAGKIQSEMKYPGEIKVNVIRELRAVEYAR